jgi:DNA-binding CsgD family transcriptional regulator
MTQVNQLSNREWDVVRLLIQGKSNKLIAASLGISSRTVEFHLKNIYAKYQVYSRMELVLKLVNAPGQAETGQLGHSTVVGMGKKIENRDIHNPRPDWVPAFDTTASMVDKESGMKQLLFTKHTLVGFVTALLTGSLWVAVLDHFGHMSANSVLPWILPLVIVWAVIGASIGFMGKRNSNSLLKVSFSTIFGTGLGAFAMLPLVAGIVYPLAKLAERLGLLNRSAIPTDITSTFVIVVMLVIWLIVAIAIGLLLLRLTLKKTGSASLSLPASQHGL